MTRGEISKLATAIDRWLCHQSDADQEYVFLSNARRVGVRFEQGQGRGLEAMRACQRAFGLSRGPSRDAYRVWLRDEPVGADWPSPANIEAAFGSWKAARLAADGTWVPLEAVNLPRLGPYLSDQQLVELLRRWQAEAPDTERRASLFTKWLRDGAGGWTCENRVNRVPISATTWSTRFRSWALALEKADLLGSMRFDAFCRLMARSSIRHSNDELGVLLREFVQWAGDADLPLQDSTIHTYRAQRLEQGWRTGRALSFPIPVTFADRFGKMDLALRAAGLDDLRWRSGTECPSERNQLRNRDRYRHSDIVWWIHGVAHCHGGDPSWSQVDRLRACVRTATGVAAPSPLTLCRHMRVNRLDTAIERGLALPVPAPPVPVERAGVDRVLAAIGGDGKPWET